MIDYTIDRNSLLNVDIGNPVAREHPLNRGMVGWWLGLPHLVGGNTVYDLGGKWHGTYYSDTTSKPKWSGRSFPGGYASTYIDGNSNQYISLPDFSGAFTTSEGTFSCWVYRDPNGTVGGYPSAGLVYLGPQSQVTVYAGPGGCYFAVFETSIRPIDAYHFTAYDLWRHLVITSKPGTNNYRLFSNGKLMTTGTQSSFGLPTNPRFGAASPYNIETLMGWAGDWRLWNRALSDDEVQQLYDESVYGYPNMLNRTSTMVFFPGITTPNRLGGFGYKGSYSF